MMICEFCRQYQANRQCAVGLAMPKAMSCREFDPGIEKFCANPADFTGAGQLIQMSVFFGIKGVELKKIKQLAAHEEQARADAQALRVAALAIDPEAATGIALVMNPDRHAERKP